MFLKQLDIKNFRGIEELSLPLEDLCVLIGENNAGKSSVLDALRLCLTRSLTRKAAVFEEYDYHLADSSADPAKAKPIEITLTFAEREEDEWPDEISQMLDKAEQVDENALRSVTLRVRSHYDPAINDYATEYDFLDLSGEPLVQAKNPRQLINLQQLVPTFYLASLRDAAQEFRARSAFWGPFVKALELDDDAREELEKALHLWRFQSDAFEWLDALPDTAPDAEGLFDEYEEEKETWNQLVNEIAAQYGKQEVTLHLLLQELDLRSKSPEPPKGAIPCFTIHASKGMEFDHVYLVGMVEDQLPSWAAIKKGYDSREMQEERRNCFVGITRAQETLTLSYSDRVQGWAKRPSRFLYEMGVLES